MNQTLIETAATIDRVHEEIMPPNTIGSVATRGIADERGQADVSTSSEYDREAFGNKELLDEHTWGRITKKIERQYDGVDGKLSERILDQTLGFLSLVSKDKEHTYSPSPLVDKGWHTFILYTKEYSDFCNSIAGQYIHHSPNDDPNVKTVVKREDPVEAMKRLGITVDEQLWEVSSVGCDGHTTCDSPV